MERDKLSDLEAWLKDPLRKPLMIFGPRQCGKSYLAEDLFAKRFFPGEYIYLDLKKDSAANSFLSSTVDPEKILTYLSARFNKDISKDTLLIFDEVQECLPIVTALKYFKQDHPEIPVIETGSMVRIKIKRKKRGPGEKNFFYPVGSVHEMMLSPLGFGEFLSAKNPKMKEAIKEAYQKKTPLSSGLHEEAMDLLYEFLLIGGMPAVLQAYFSSSSLIKAREEQNDIYNDYLADMDLYQVSSESLLRTREMFSSAYRQLSKENENFSFKEMKTGNRSRDFSMPLDWLRLAGVCLPCFTLKEKISLPLREEDASTYRIYLLDNGLLAKQSQINMGNFIDPNSRNDFEGVFFENYIATEFTKVGVPLFAWKGKGNHEFEFVVNKGGLAVPIDVKKGKGSLNSLEAFRNHNKRGLAVKISKNNYGYDEKSMLLTLPLYMVPCFAEELASLS
jgi:predicted AAA+ superfamily ATPase